MRDKNVNAQVFAFDAVLSARFPTHADPTLVSAVREIYATKVANTLLRSISLLFGKAMTASGSEATEAGTCLRPRLPQPSVVRKVGPKLCDAVNSNDVVAAADALRDMGVLALCPDIEVQLKRLEFSVGSVIGRFRLLPLVELAIFAAEVDAVNKVSDYLSEAYTLSPTAAELHDLHALSGLVAVRRGNIKDGKRFLLDSVRVCRVDDLACLSCSLRPINLMLADKLLDIGETETVVKYLAQCLSIWRNDESTVSEWIASIRKGQKPSILRAGPQRLMNEPVVRMRMTILKGELLSASPMDTKTEAGYSGVQSLLREHKRSIAAALKGKLERGWN